MKIGLIGVSGKPIHSGHWALIHKISNINDKVRVFVSLADRIDKQTKIKILGADMYYIWTEYLLPNLPYNVTVEFGGSPIKKIYQFIGDNQNESDIEFNIYSESKDLLNDFPMQALMKYFAQLNSDNKIKLVPISRKDTKNISGTEMRNYLYNGNKSKFIENLPDVIDGEKAWDLFSRRININY